MRSRLVGRRRGAALTFLLVVGLAVPGCGDSTGRQSARQRAAPATPPAPRQTTAPAPATAPATTGPGSGATGSGATGSGATGSGTTAAPPAGSPAGAPPPAHPVPATFRVAPGAPSDEQVRRELRQLERIRREQRRAEALSAAPPDAAGLLPWDQEPKSGRHVSVASVFRDYGLGLACGGVLGRNQLGVAHKTAPCGTLVTFRYAGRVLRVPVIDRGPFIAGREWDLTGAAADALGFPGLDSIEWSVRRRR